MDGRKAMNRRRFRLPNGLGPQPFLFSASRASVNLIHHNPSPGQVAVAKYSRLQITEPGLRNMTSTDANAWPMSSTPQLSESSDDRTIEVLAEMNSEGASHLELCFYDEAISTFRAALVVAIRDEVSGHLGDLKSLLGTTISSSEREPYLPRPSDAAGKPKRRTKRRNKPGRRGSINSVGSKDSASSPPSSRRERRREIARRVRSVLGFSVHNKDEKATTEDILKPSKKYVYSKPLRVRDRYDLPSQGELMIYLVHNLALSYQLKATSSSDNDTILTEGDSTESNDWERIIQLYKLTSDMIEKEQNDQEQSQDAMIDPNSPLWSPTSMVSVPNNLACAYHASGDEVNADATWQQALAHIWCMLDLGCISEVACYAEILENATHLMDSGVKASPATAA